MPVVVLDCLGTYPDHVRQYILSVTPSTDIYQKP